MTKPPLRFEVYAVAYDSSDKPLGYVVTVANDLTSCSTSGTIPDPTAYPEDVRARMKTTARKILDAIESDERLRFIVERPPEQKS